MYMPMFGRSLLNFIPECKILLGIEKISQKMVEIKLSWWWEYIHVELPINLPINVSVNIIMLIKHLFSKYLGIKFISLYSNECYFLFDAIFQWMLFLGINLVNLKQAHPNIYVFSSTCIWVFSTLLHICIFIVLLLIDIVDCVFIYDYKLCSSSHFFYDNANVGVFQSLYEFVTKIYVLVVYFFFFLWPRCKILMKFMIKVIICMRC